MDPVNTMAHCYVENFCSQVLNIVIDYKSMQRHIWDATCFSDPNRSRDTVEDSCSLIIKRGRQSGNSAAIFKLLNYLPGNTVFWSGCAKETYNIDLPKHVQHFWDDQQVDTIIRDDRFGNFGKDSYIENVIIGDTFSMNNESARTKRYKKAIDFATTVFTRQGYLLPFVVVFVG